MLIGRHPITGWLAFTRAYIVAVREATVKVQQARGLRVLKAAYFCVQDVESGALVVIEYVGRSNIVEAGRKQAMNKCFDEMNALREGNVPRVPGSAVNGTCVNGWGGALKVPGPADSPCSQLLGFYGLRRDEDDLAVLLIAALQCNQISQREATQIALQTSNDVFLSLVEPRVPLFSSKT